MTIGAAELIEIVDVFGAKVRPGRLEQIAQRHALAFRFRPVDVDEELRHVDHTSKTPASAGV